MKNIILFLTLIFTLHWAFAQTGTITNIQVAQGVGENERVVNIQFDLTGDAIVYDISLEVSFDNGVTFEPIAPAEVTGETNVAPGTGIQLIWDGRISYPVQFTDMARIKIIASSFICGETITDIDGNIYNTVLIGNQCWMKENLNVGTRINSITNQANNGTIEKYCYSNSESNCDIYGGLYQWDEMMNYSTTPGAQGICPTGWHLPTDGEWNALETYVSSQAAWLCNSNSSYIAKALAATTNWSANSNTCAIGNNLAANNATGFSGLPGGNRNPNSLFNYQSYIGNWWSSTQIDASNAWYRDLNYTNSDVWRHYYPKGFGFAVRCLKVIPTYNLNLDVDPSGAGTVSGAGQYAAGDALAVSATANPGWQFVNWTDENGIISAAAGFTYIMPGQDITLTANFIEEVEFTCGTSTIADIEGNIYNTVLIGSQCWMKENLKYLPAVVGHGTGSYTVPYYYVYGYNGTNVSAAKATTNYQNYGALYNWSAALTACPPGWHLPSDAEWTQLTNHVVAQSFPNNNVINGAGNALKSCRQVNSPLGGVCNTSTHPRWDSHSNNYGFDEFGFSAIPGGYRDISGGFHSIGYHGNWWSSTENSSTQEYGYAWYRLMFYSYGYVTRFDFGKALGFSVRCVRDID